MLKRKEGFEDDEERTIREKKRKLAPFEKEVEKGKKVNEEREALESKIKREKQVAKERRSAKRAGLKARTRTGQPVMRHRMRAIIDKLEKT